MYVGVTMYVCMAMYVGMTMYVCMAMYVGMTMYVCMAMYVGMTMYVCMAMYVGMTMLVCISNLLYNLNMLYISSYAETNVRFTLNLAHKLVKLSLHVQTTIK